MRLNKGGSHLPLWKLASRGDFRDPWEQRICWVMLPAFPGQVAEGATEVTKTEQERRGDEQQQRVKYIAWMNPVRRSEEEICHGLEHEEGAEELPKWQIQCTN